MPRGAKADPMAESRLVWQDEALHAMIDLDPSRLCATLDRLPKKAKKPCEACVATLADKSVGGFRFFVLGDRMYTTSPLGMREQLGGNFSFEDEEERATLASWLEMVGAKPGDTLLHLALRINGASDGEKAALAVELIGRGATWEAENIDRELPSQVDRPAFRYALFTLLPKWREEEAARAAERRRKAQLRKKAEERARAVEVAGRKREKIRGWWRRVRDEAKNEVQRDKDRTALHTALHKVCDPHGRDLPTPPRMKKASPTPPGLPSPRPSPCVRLCRRASRSWRGESSGRRSPTRRGKS